MNPAEDPCRVSFLCWGRDALRCARCPGLLYRAEWTGEPARCACGCHREAS